MGEVCAFLASQKLKFHSKFDGETVRTGDELQKMLTYYKGGTSVTLTVQSLENGSYVERQIPITLGYKKDSQKQEVQEN